MDQRPFKLLRLPTLALQNVLQFLNPIDLFELSQCSQKTRFNIPLAGTKKFHCRINVASYCIVINNYVFCVKRQHCKTGSKLRGNRNFMGIIADVAHELEHEIISFWNNIDIGLKNVLFHVTKVFDCTIKSFESLWTIPAAIFNSIIDSIITRQSEIGKLAIEAHSLTDEDVMKIFSSLRITEDLELSSLQITEDLEFRYRFSRSQTIPFNTKSVLIRHSYWITPTHLSAMKNCIIIDLKQSTLTDDDMKWLLESWKLGEYPNLEYLSIKSDALSRNFTAFGLPSLQDTVNPHFFKKLVLGEHRIVYGAIDIQRGDGAAAKINFDVKDSIVDLLVL
ncbi:hypothetical protein GCK72_011388 [Caenorhabditis remanei]|uniref:F-box domain-containing protein n=1 Tax=Caenorhabditis remanei TaxID=31234 RepID=A0A6A5H9P3_CAERE|nr:hypothetical protein GCK72_011388 [Caenorhabditis remanei]KAF1763122.1 hypothetical protein GCK72_011388 [Caenorhabditis remanei]